MTTSTEVEAEARILLREVIEASGWYLEMSADERERRIDQEVEANWHLMINEARKAIEGRK